jgi:thioester reductase-like protein
MKTYFVTGATGAIGACLVSLLLHKEDTQVRLLIRAQCQHQLDDRLRKLLDFWEHSSGDGTARRIKAYRGDVSLPFLGLSQDDYHSLTRECSHIIHSAGNVRMNLTLEEARTSSVNAARNIAAFAWDCRKQGSLEKLEYVSTIGVAGRMPGVIPETWITEIRSFHNTYEEAKAEAEVFIRGQIEKGLPATVHRPSMVVGDSGTGKIIHFQVFYHICEFLSGRRTFGILPRVGNACLDVIPVNYVANVIVWSSNQRSTIGKVLHSCSGPEHSIAIDKLKNQVHSIFKSSGQRLPRSRTIPLGTFQKCLPLMGLLVSQPLKKAVKALPLFLDYLSEEQSYANENTRKMLESEGIKLPMVAEYLVRNLEYYLSALSEKKSSRGEN